MKIFIGILLLTLSTIIGYTFSQKYKKRQDFFNDFEKFNKNLLNEVGFRQKPLRLVLSSVKNENDFYILTEKYLSNEKSNFNLNYLKKEEIDLYNNFLLEIGVGDVETQTKILKSYESKLFDIAKSTAEEYKKYHTLYIKIGFLIGLILFIMLI